MLRKLTKCNSRSLSLQMAWIRLKGCFFGDRRAELIRSGVNRSCCVGETASNVSRGKLDRKEDNKGVPVQS